MKRTLKTRAAGIFTFLLAGMLLLSTSGCLPLLIYDLSQESPTQVTELPPVEYEAQGSFKDLSFEELCDELFEHEITWDSLGFNQLVSDPEELGLEAPRPATLGDYSHEATQADNLFYTEILEALTSGQTFTIAELSEQQQREAERIENVLRQTLRYEEFYYYYEPLSPSTGAQASLPLNLMDYSFRTTEDIEIYLEILEDVPRYFDQLIQLENEKRDNGILMARECMYSSIEEAKAYAGSVNEHILVTVFDEMLDAALEDAGENGASEDGLTSLDAGEITKIKERNRLAIEQFVIPSYEKLIVAMEELAPSCSEGTRLYDYPKGKEYYELEMEAYGFNESPASAATTLDAALDGYWNTISMSTESLIPESAVQSIGDDPEDYIAYVREHSTADFASADLTYSIKIAPEGSPNDYAMAYFLIPPVDDPHENNIVFFPRNISDDVELYSTMAHEGYPGHMYQVYAYSLENPSNVSKLLGSLAYMEGWAMYVQAYAMSYLPYNPGAIEAYSAYEKFFYGLQARVDIGVNYEGWTLSDTEAYLNNWGFANAAQGLYEVSIEQPVAYLPYGLGVVEFDYLLETAKYELGNEFDPIVFHQKITSIGPVSFETLEREYFAWLTEITAKEL